jgi:hypothetical protein
LFRNLDKNPFNTPPKQRIIADVNMRKAVIVTILILTILLTMVAGTQFVKAYPQYERDAESLIKISISSPENNELYNTRNVKLDFNITVGETTDHSLISNISYETDWQKENKTIFSFDGYFLRELMAQLSYPRTFFTEPTSKLFRSLELTDIPEGNHSIIIYTTVWHYSSIEKIKDVFEYYFQYRDLTMANRSTTVFFAVDTIAPKITVFSPKNMTYDSSIISTDFKVEELFSKCSYRLDGQDNVTTTGNMTLTGLLNGEHNITIYATDTAGNTGSSETIYFTIAMPESFPTVVVVVVSVVTLALAVAGLLVYHKKRRR